MPPPNHERLYVDLIFRSSRKDPNWDPEVTIQVGDYGRITQGKRGLKFWMKNRGTFLKEGNIYKEGLAKQYEIPEAVEHGAAATEGITWITSKNARDISVEAGFYLSPLAQANAGTGGMRSESRVQIHFGARGGARHEQ